MLNKRVFSHSSIHISTRNVTTNLHGLHCTYSLEGPLLKLVPYTSFTNFIDSLNFCQLFSSNNPILIVHFMNIKTACIHRQCARTSSAMKLKVMTYLLNLFHEI